VEDELNDMNNLKNLLHEDYYLGCDNLVLYKKSDVECGSINDIIESANNIPLINDAGDDSKSNNQSTLNQMHRIEDGRISATKMVLMHLVTGQGIKHFMVKDTIELAKTLFESTDLKIVQIPEKVGGDISEIPGILTKQKLPMIETHKILQKRQNPQIPQYVYPRIEEETLQNLSLGNDETRLAKLPRLPELKL
jgi:hypothetical protein